MTNARMRTIYGRTQMFPLSRFLNEIPGAMIEKYSGRQNHYGFASSSSRAAIIPPVPSSVVQSPLRSPVVNAHPQKEQNGAVWRVADKARHAKWGLGTVIEVKGSGDSQELKIAFPGLGIKLVIANMAPITKA